MTESLKYLNFLFISNKIISPSTPRLYLLGWTPGLMNQESHAPLPEIPGNFYSSSKLISLTEVVLMTSWRIVLNVQFSVGLQENCTLAKSSYATQWGEHAHKHICKMAGKVRYYHLNCSTSYCWTEKKIKFKDTSFCSESDRKCNTILFQLCSSFIGTEEEIN